MSERDDSFLQSSVINTKSERKDPPGIHVTGRIVDKSERKIENYYF